MRQPSLACDQPHDQHIVIVGGGMVGLSLALMLAKQLPAAHAISLVETVAFPSSSSEVMQQPSFDARSTAISAGSASLLQHIHVWPSLLPEAESINRIHISDRGHYGSTQIDGKDYPCLLYTSPSPRDRTRSRMPSSA